MNRNEALAELGLAEETSAEEIKKAFYRASQKAHPDSGGDEDSFCRVNTAYRLLSGKEKPSADKKECEASSMAAAAFMQNLKEAIRCHVDPVAAADVCLLEKKRNAENKIKELETYRDELHSVLKKLNRKKGEPVIENVIKGCISELTETMASTKEHVAVIDMAIKFVNELEWHGITFSGGADISAMIDPFRTASSSMFNS